MRHIFLIILLILPAQLLAADADNNDQATNSDPQSCNCSMMADAAGQAAKAGMDCKMMGNSATSQNDTADSGSCKMMGAEGHPQNGGDSHAQHHASGGHSGGDHQAVHHSSQDGSGAHDSHQ